MKYFTLKTDIADTMIDLLTQASEVRFNNRWYPVLGYDQEDDILCIAAYVPENDITIKDASKTINPESIRVALPINY